MSNEVVGLASRGEIATHVAQFIQDTSTARRQMILRDLDYGYRQALERYEWPGLLRWDDTSVSVANNDAYFFAPKGVRTILGLIDATTPFVTQELSAFGLISQTGGFTQIAGVPTNHAYVGQFGIKIAIDAGTELEVLSSGTPDVREGFVRGLRSGEQKTVPFTLDGTSVVNVGLWDEVYQFSLSEASSSRTVTLRTVTNATTAATIAPGEMQSLYERHRFFTLSSGARSYRIVYKYTPPTVFDEDHIYLIPIQNYLIEWGIAKSYESRRQYDLAQAHVAMGEAALSKTWYEICGNRIETSTPLGALARITQGAGIVINAYGYR